jgi:hypothetical protein
MKVCDYYWKDGNIFLPWDMLYPECRVLRKEHSKTYVAMCFNGEECPAVKNCGETVVKRVHFWYEKLEPTAKGLFVYFKKEGTDSIGVVYFGNDLNTIRMILPVNRSGFNTMVKEAKVKQLVLPDEYINIHGTYKTPAIIPVESLLK